MCFEKTKRSILPFSFFLLALALSTVGYGCKKDNGQMQSLSLKGVVRDSSGMPLSGVQVTTGSLNVTTAANGSFEFSQARVVNERAVVLFEKEGYFKLTRSNFKANEIYMEAMLHAKGNSHTSLQTTFHTSEAKDLLVPAGMKVALSASSIMRADGSAYNGEVKVDMLYLDPNHGYFADIMPGGDLAALSADESEVQLISYGMTDVQFADNAGNPLQLKNNSPAEMTFPIPQGMEDNPPPRIPLWSFDEEQGIWLEDGEATLQGEVYVGPARHFSWKNLDLPAGRVTIKGKVSDCANNPVPFLKVRAWQNAASTGNNGDYVIFVPAYTDITVKADVQGGTSREVPGQAPGAVVEGQDLSVPCGIGSGGGILGTLSDTDKGSVKQLTSTGVLQVISFDNNRQRLRFDSFPEIEGQGGPNHQITLADHSRDVCSIYDYSKGEWGEELSFEALKEMESEIFGGSSPAEVLRIQLEEMKRQLAEGNVPEEMRASYETVIAQLEASLENLDASLGDNWSPSQILQGFWLNADTYKVNEAKLLSEGFKKLPDVVINGYLCKMYSGTVRGCEHTYASWNGLMMLFEDSCKDGKLVGQAATLEVPPRAFEQTTLRVDWLADEA
ncbi:MAG: carboxypeptidase-like regulatory domain-containing protein [Cystobacterineae bacterium]|nr:carboxypeptidase-like regulatory domain-containing protein [Cystobacterineae bacterium]